MHVELCKSLVCLHDYCCWYIHCSIRHYLKFILWNMIMYAHALFWVLLFFFFLTSPYIFYAWVILKLFLESTFSFLLVSPVQSSLRINEWNYLLCFFLLASLMFFALFCLLFSFLLMLRGKKRFSKERHSTRPSAWEWYGKSSRTQLHPLKIVSTPTQFTLLRKP